MFSLFIMRFLPCIGVDSASYQVVCIGSVEELEQLSGVKVTDLHRERYM